MKTRAQLEREMKAVRVASEAGVAIPLRETARLYHEWNLMLGQSLAEWQEKQEGKP